MQNAEALAWITESVELLAQDLTNAEIADRLFVPRRTAGNHLAASLRKFDVPTRAAEVQAARDIGFEVILKMGTSECRRRTHGYGAPLTRTGAVVRSLQ